MIVNFPIKVICVINKYFGNYISDTLTREKLYACDKLAHRSYNFDKLALWKLYV